MHAAGAESRMAPPVEGISDVIIATSDCWQFIKQRKKTKRPAESLVAWAIGKMLTHTNPMAEATQWVYDAYSKLNNVTVLRILVVDSNTKLNLSRGNTVPKEMDLT